MAELQFPSRPILHPGFPLIPCRHSTRPGHSWRVLLFTLHFCRPITQETQYPSA